MLRKLGKIFLYASGIPKEFGSGEESEPTNLNVSTLDNEHFGKQALLQKIASLETRHVEDEEIIQRLGTEVFRIFKM